MNIETERLYITEITLDDAPFILELMNSPHWLKYIGDRQLSTIKDTKKYLKKGILKSYQIHGFGFYKLQLKSDKSQIVGICGLVKRETLPDVDLGFAMLPEYEGMGFGYESSIAVMNYAKETLKMSQLLAITLPTNKNAIRLIERLGFSFQKMVIPFDDNEKLMLFAKIF